jgi:hypothetical protein
VTTWPGAGVALWAELERAAGRFALLCGEGADDVAAELADLQGAVPLHIGRALAASVSAPDAETVRACLAGHPVLIGTHVLFDPVLNVDPVRLLSRLARDAPPVVAVWPVPTTVRPLVYPPSVTPGRDTGADLQGCLLLTTRPTVFADEAPFTSERFT